MHVADQNIVPELSPARHPRNSTPHGVRDVLYSLLLQAQLKCL